MMFLKMVTMMKMTMTMIAMILLLEMSHQTGRTFSRKAKEIEDKRALRRNKVEQIGERRKTPNHPMPLPRLVPRRCLLLRHATSGTWIRVLKTTKQFTKQTYFYIFPFLSEKKTPNHNICHDVMLTLLRLKLCMYIAECQVC